VASLQSRSDRLPRLAGHRDERQVLVVHGCGITILYLVHELHFDESNCLTRRCIRASMALI